MLDKEKNTGQLSEFLRYGMHKKAWRTDKQTNGQTKAK